MADRTARILHSIEEISSAEWNACANPAVAGAYNPFLRFEFLRALEARGSAVGGWPGAEPELPEPTRVSPTGLEFFLGDGDIVVRSSHRAGARLSVVCISTADRDSGRAEKRHRLVESGVQLPRN